MLTKVLIVEPVACYTFESECAAECDATPKRCATEAHGPVAGTAGFEANGQVLAALSALVTKLAAALPTLLPEIQALIALFGQPKPAAS